MARAAKNRRSVVAKGTGPGRCSRSRARAAKRHFGGVAEAQLSAGYWDTARDGRMASVCKRVLERVDAADSLFEKPV